ncbi:hypothetical protein BH23ACI1_BH23ACI1_15100 [soil metagenome]
MLNPLRTWPVHACLAAVLVVLAGAPVRAGAEEPLLFRIFLQDGSTLVSYGQFARVADRVVFSIPVGAADDSNLQLVSIAESLVDWERTDDYTVAVRAAQFDATIGPEQFALLGNRVTEALTDIRLTADPARQLAMAQEARRNLGRWPLENYGYRADDVTRMVDLFDEVISELRIAAGQPGFELRLSANTTSPPRTPLLPPLDFRQSLEQAAALARLAADPGERVALLRAVAGALRPQVRAAQWAADLHGTVTVELAAELRIQRQYQDLVMRTTAVARARAARADVSGLLALTRATLQADDRLGRRRPQEMSALLSYLDVKLDEARDIQAAREVWAARRALFEDYRRNIVSPLEQLRGSRTWLAAVRDARGVEPAALERQERRTVMARRVLDNVPPPAELATVHTLYTTAFHMAHRAAASFRTGVSSNNAQLALDASSAAAGSLMLLAQADEELARLIASPNR